MKTEHTLKLGCTWPVYLLAILAGFLVLKGCEAEASEPVRFPAVTDDSPTLTVYGQDVTGATYHGPQGMGFTPGWVQISASGHCKVIRWDVWIVEGRRLDGPFDVDRVNWTTLNSWEGKHQRLRATVQTWEGHRELWVDVIFDGEP